MDWINVIQAVVLGIVEGLTEFLPVSSTGHLIVVSEMIGFSDQVGADTFVVSIQTGAILAVCVYYHQRILNILKGLFSEPVQQRLVINTLIAFMPAVVLGLLFADVVKTYLFSPITVATALVVGGVFILWIERYHQNQHVEPRVQTMDDMTWKDALKVGLMQCLALIPGTSRSGATIIGGVVMGLSRTAATEFSFFLAIPTIFGATVYDLWSARETLEVGNLSDFAIGTAVSFLSAIVVVHWFVRYVSKNDFKIFGWYRIIFGGLILLTWATGLVRW